jgi:hypothetical protein
VQRGTKFGKDKCEFLQATLVKKIKENYRIASDTDLVGYPAGRYPVNLKAGYRISGWITGAGRIPGIQPDNRCMPDTGYPAGF